MLLVADSGSALAEETVYYAGFAYNGNTKHIGSIYRHTDSIDPVPSCRAVGSRTPQLDKVLHEHVSSVRFSRLNSPRLHGQEGATLESSEAIFERCPLLIWTDAIF